MFTLILALSAIAFVKGAAMPRAPAAGNNQVCTQGIYKDLTPLSAYPPAVSFCSAKFPIPPVVTTVTTGFLVTSFVTPTGELKRCRS